MSTGPTFFNQEGTILEAVANALQQLGVSTLPGQWEPTVARCQVRAYNEIVTALSMRGFLPEQIALWDRGAEFELDLAVYLALNFNSAVLNLTDDQLKSLKMFDRRADLAGTALTIGGVFQDPAGTAGLVGAGDVETGSDTFVWPDRTTQDNFPGPGIGRPARF